MATSHTVADTSSGQGAARAKLPEGFVPNEPKGGGTGEGGVLSGNQLSRAASEALLSLRPQPSAEEIQRVLEALAEKDDKGQPKNKLKTAKEAGDKAVEELNKQRAA